MGETKKQGGVINFLQEFSIPLLAGVAAGLIWVNFGPSEAYTTFIKWRFLGEHATVFGHHIDVLFLVNDVFMPFFFGIAAAEITESFLKGGDLNPISKAYNPLFATLGGVLVPVWVYRLLADHFFGNDPETFAEVWNGWGIPTATDIALAWLLARIVFGANHPAVKYLLLLAIADDAIGLGIIAVKYPDLAHPVHLEHLWLVGLGMCLAYLLRRINVKRWGFFIAIGGVLSWIGLLKSSLHPALAFVFIVPFMPGPSTDTGLFTKDDEVDQAEGTHGETGKKHSTLHNYKHRTEIFVNFGLFFFGLVNAGVAFGSVTNVTWTVFGALLMGKTLGVTVFAMIGVAIGWKLPKGMTIRHVFVVGVIAALGLTVALFVTGEAFVEGSSHLDPAKMGAVLTLLIPIIAIPLGKLLRVRQLAD